MYGKCARNITHVPEICLVETCQVNGSCPFNVPDMFPPVSRGPRPQCQVDAIDEGCKGTFVRIDKDLEALDQRVNRCRQECERTEESLQAAEGRIEVLEERSINQRQLIAELMARVDAMEGQLCRCGKGKGKEVVEEVPSILGSPLILDRPMEEVGSDDSYHTPPLAGSSAPSIPSSVVESDKENFPAFGIGFDPRKVVLVPINEAPPENTIPIPVREPSIDLLGLDRLIAVRGQRAVRRAGRPKSSFHPYLSCSCPIGERSTTHRRSQLCCRDRGVEGDVLEER